MKIISENHDKENGIWKPTIAFNLPQTLTEYTFTITEDMIRASGVCPLVFVKELEKELNKEFEEVKNEILNTNKPSRYF